jgi:hypothetical protein
MASPSSKPVWALLAMALVLVPLVGLVGSGERSPTRPRALPVSAPWERVEEPILHAPVILPPLDSEAPAPPRPEPPAAPEGREERWHLVGFVLRPEGEPASGARVVLGSRQARCDPDGRFELALAGGEAGADLIAFEPGHEPVWHRSEGNGAASPEAGVLRIVLGPETLALSGTVVGHDGLPLPGWTVELDGPDPLRDAKLREPVRTDGEGRFLITDVPAGVHVVRVWRESRELAVRSTPFLAGEQGLEIVAE